MSTTESRVFVPEHKAQLQKIIKTNRIVVLKLGAEWCQPCVACAPHYAEMSKRHPEVVFLSVDIDKNCGDSTWSELFRCSGVPMFISFLNYQSSEEFMGADLVPIEEWINSAKTITQQTTALNTEGSY